MSDKFSRDQDLVAAQDEHSMVCALPGSGKTHTLVSLSKNLLEKNRDYRLLIITFTRAAAKEIAERLESRLPPHLYQQQRVRASTFDAVFGRIVKDTQTGVRKRTICGGDQIGVVFRAMNRAGSQWPLEIASEWIDRYGRILSPAPHPKDSDQQGWAIFQHYQQILQESNRQDFNSIARQAVAWTESNQWQPSTHIMVDEFQDTSAVQYHWIRLMGQRGCTLFTVGDDDQSIYSWRGAIGYQNMIQFQRDFSATAFILRYCFRCRPEILMTAQRLVEHNHDRIDKDMNAAKPAGGEVWLSVYPSRTEEADCTAEAVTEALAKGLNSAVLARTNLLLSEVEAALNILETPYKRLGGKKLWDHHDAIAALKFLWCIRYPQRWRHLADTLSWLNEEEMVINNILQQLRRRQTFTQLTNDGTWSSATASWQQSLLDWHTETDQQSLMSSRIEAMLQFIHETRGKKASGVPLVNAVIQSLSRFNPIYAWQQRLEILIRHLEGKDEPTTEASDSDKATITLTTLHASKGLQFDHVYMVSQNQEVCPSKRALETGSIDEERRLVYVGMTRAIERLHLSYVHERESPRRIKREPSQFLCETAPKAIQTLTEKIQANPNCSHTRKLDAI